MFIKQNTSFKDIKVFLFDIFALYIHNRHIWSNIQLIKQLESQIERY